MTVTNPSNKSYSSTNLKSDSAVIIPGEMTYKYLRREIMLGTMAVNTIVKVNANYYYKHYYNSLIENAGYDSDDSSDSSEDSVPYYDNSAYDDDYYDEDDDFDDGEDDTEIIEVDKEANEDNIEANEDDKDEDSNLEETSIDEVFSYKTLTIIFLALIQDDDDFVDFLIDNQADVGLTTHGCGPIIYTAMALKKYKYVQKLLDNGFPIDYRANSPELLTFYDNYTLLEAAVQLNDHQLVKYLIHRGAHVNYETKISSRLPLVLAATSGNIKMMKLLIENGAEIDYQVLEGLVLGYNPKGLKILLNHPAADLSILRAQNLEFKDSILSHMMSYGDEKVLRYLLDAGVDVNIVKDGVIFYDNPENYCSPESVATVKRHVIKLIAAGIPVCEENQKVKNEEKLEFFLQECEEEIEVLKKVPICGTDFSCYDLLHKSDDELISSLGNFDNCVDVEKVLKKEFPLYGRMIAIRIVKSIRNFCLDEE